MGCGSSKELNPYEENGVPQFSEPPPRYNEKQGQGQMQIHAPQQQYTSKTSSDRAAVGSQIQVTIPQQACNNKIPPGYAPAPARALPQCKPKGKATIQAQPRMWHNPSALLNGSPFNSPDSPKDNRLFWEPSPKFKNAQKNVGRGHAAPTRPSRKAVVEMEQTNCTGRSCKNRLTADDIENWKWIRDMHNSDAKPQCARCLKEKQLEDNKWARNATGGFRDISDMRQTNTHDFVQGQYSPI